VAQGGGRPPPVKEKKKRERRRVQEEEKQWRMSDNETIYEVSKQLCWGCMGESLQFLFAHKFLMWVWAQKCIHDEPI
jgi:hypothetical protein